MSAGEIFRSAFYGLVKYSFLTVYSLYNRLEVFGLSNIPRGVTVIVAANHASLIDPPLIGGVFPVRLRYLAKESLFRNPFFGSCIRALGALPVTREDSRRAGAALKMMLGCLRAGQSVLVFPEGSRTRDGRIQPLEGGAAFLSIKSGAPIVPAYIAGSFAAFPPGGKFPRPAKMRVTFAPPIWPPVDGAERERRDEITRRLASALGDMEAAADARR